MPITHHWCRLKCRDHLQSLEEWNQHTLDHASPWPRSRAVGSSCKKVKLNKEDISYNVLKFLLEEPLKTLINDAPYLDVAQERYIVVVVLLVAFHFDIQHDCIVVVQHLVVMVDGCLRASIFLSHHDPKMPSCVREVEEVAAIGSDEDGAAAAAQFL